MDAWRNASVKRLFFNGYVAGLLAASIILLILIALQPIFGGSPSLLLFLVAVLLAAWRGGFGAGFAVTVFSALVSVYFLLEPYNSLAVTSPKESLRLLLLVGVGIAMSWVAEQLRRAERRAMAAVLAREQRLHRELLERRDAEYTLYAVKQALEREIADRKVAEAKLQEQAERLREADRRKNEFIAMLGHELRNPLAPIRNAVRIMRRLDAPDPTLQWAREVVDRQVDHLARLVDDLLDVSRIVQGKLTLKKALVDIATVVDQAVETCKPLLEARRHRFVIALPDQPVYLQGDGVRLAQAISNLLVNAAKYTPDGGEIGLTATRDNSELVILVKDTGEGIAPSLLPHLFEVFSQAERTLDRAQGGLGLGLTIVQKIVELHGGRVDANSEGPGKGSEFIVRLPLECVTAMRENGTYRTTIG